MSQPILFGIPNCDTVRKARKWMESQGIAHEFIDLRADTPPAQKINEWLSAVGPDRLINRPTRSTDWLTDRPAGRPTSRPTDDPGTYILY